MHRWLGVLLIFCFSEASAEPPQLFLYPPGYTLANGTWVAATITTNLRQATEAFPTTGNLKGVVLAVYWSQLCPKENQCNFRLVDAALRYWGARGKKVVLSVPTVGFPAERMSTDGPKFETATPGWVLAQVKTYQHITNTAIGVIPGIRPPSMTYPVYNDRRFLNLVQKLVRELGRFDGNPDIAQIRISTGLQAEDNPSLDAFKWTIPGMNDLAWIAYCRDVTSMFLNVFHRSQTEFDLDRLSWIAVTGSTTARRDAENFVHLLIHRKVFLAFNGLSPSSADSAREKIPKTGPAQSLKYLAFAQAHGDGIGLEAAQPLYTRMMQGIPQIAEAIIILHPDRLVLFGDAGAASQTANSEERTFSTSPSLKAKVNGNFKQLMSLVHEPEPR